MSVRANLRGMRDKYAKRNGIGAGNPANRIGQKQETCLTGLLEYKYRVIFVLVLGVISVLYEVQLDNKRSK